MKSVTAAMAVCNSQCENGSAENNESAEGDKENERISKYYQSILTMIIKAIILGCRQRHSAQA
jgi:hypothetical protein